MEILIKDIPPDGLNLHFDSNADGWFRDLLTESLAKLHQKEDRAEAHFTIFKTGSNIDCTGRLTSDSHPVCSRCLKVFHQPIDIPFHMTLAPLYEDPRQLAMEQKEEIELVKEDLDFCFYEGDSFDLGEMIREQIILELPMQSLCEEECKGLCPHCGQNLNEGPCRCRSKHVDPRWAPLKSIQTKK